MKLLIPLNLTSLDSSAIAYCRTIDRLVNDVVFVHVVPPASRTGLAPVVAYLEALGQPLEKAGIEVEHVVRSGETASVIRAVAEETGCDHIVVGMFGHEAHPVAKELLRTSSRPVVVLNQAAARVPHAA
jgi:nucleotide-binding universal stress UspA family protein